MTYNLIKVFIPIEGNLKISEMSLSPLINTGGLAFMGVISSESVKFNPKSKANPTDWVILISLPKRMPSKLVLNFSYSSFPFKYVKFHLTYQGLRVESEGVFPKWNKIWPLTEE